MYLSQKTRAHWLFSCSAGPNREVYSPPWGHWLDSLEEAKFRALVEVEEGMNELSEIKHESAPCSNLKCAMGLFSGLVETASGWLGAARGIEPRPQERPRQICGPGNHFLGLFLLFRA